MPTTPLLPLPDGLAHHCCQHEREGIADSSVLKSSEFHLPSLFKAIVRDPQLLPVETFRTAL